MDIQAHDDVTLRFKEDTILNIFEYETEDMDDSVEELFKKDSTIEVTILDVNPLKGFTNYQVQFPDSSVTFISDKFVEFILVNGEEVVSS